MDSIYLAENTMYSWTHTSLIRAPFLFQFNPRNRDASQILTLFLVSVWVREVPLSIDSGELNVVIMAIGWGDSCRKSVKRSQFV